MRSSVVDGPGNSSAADTFSRKIGFQQTLSVDGLGVPSADDIEDAKVSVPLATSKKGPDKVGVMATRGPIRPNPIGVTPCVLLGVDKRNHRLQIGEVDAVDGTPVLDIKPHQPSVDRVRDVVMPAWCRHWPDSVEANAKFDWSKEFNFPE